MACARDLERHMGLGGAEKLTEINGFRELRPTWDPALSDINSHWGVGGPCELASGSLVGWKSVVKFDQPPCIPRWSGWDARTSPPTS